MKLTLLLALLLFGTNSHADSKKPQPAVALECVLGGNPVSYPSDLDHGKTVVVHWQESEQDVQKFMFSENGLDYRVKFSSGRTWTGPVNKWEASCEYTTEFTVTIEEDGHAIASSYAHPKWMGTFTLNPAAPAAGIACATIGGAKRFWSKKPSCKTDR